MGVYGNNNDYEELVKENILKAKILYSLSDSDKILVNKLLLKKEKIKNKNGLFANFKLNQINKKISKIQKNLN